MANLLNRIFLPLVARLGLNLNTAPAENVIYLSLYQTISDGAQLKRAASAVMIRAGQGIWEDPKFREHYAAIIANQIPFGIWWFLQPDMPAAPQIEAFLKIYNSLPIKPVVIALDVEEIDYWAEETNERGEVVKVLKKLFPPSRQYSHDQILAWLKGVKAATGGKVGIYTRTYYFQEWAFETNEFYQFWLWIAAWYNYTGQVPPLLPWKWTEYKIHQYEGGLSGTPGVSGNTCKEYFNGTHEELLAFFEPPAEWLSTPLTLEERVARLEKLHPELNA
jgi:GH25 family lysozyme M1 (1,4-beta-N-acetylmuramidase)